MTGLFPQGVGNNGGNSDRVSGVLRPGRYRSRTDLIADLGPLADLIYAIGTRRSYRMAEARQTTYSAARRASDKTSLLIL